MNERRLCTAGCAPKWAAREYIAVRLDDGCPYCRIRELEAVVEKQWRENQAGAGEDMKTAEQKYLNDAKYNALVNMLESFIDRLQFTPSEMREAVMYACYRHERELEEEVARLKAAFTDLGLYVRLEAAESTLDRVRLVEDKMRLRDSECEKHNAPAPRPNFWADELKALLKEQGK